MTGELKIDQYQEGVLVGGVLVLDRNMQKVPIQKKTITKKGKWAVMASCLLFFILMCAIFPSMTMTLLLSGLVTICLYEWIPKSWMTPNPTKDSPQKRQEQRPSTEVSQFANNEKLMAEVSVANVFFHVRKVKMSESRPTLFQITVTFRVHRWHSWRPFEAFEMAQQQLRFDFPSLSIRALTLPLKDRVGDAPTKEDLVQQQAAVIVDWLLAVMDVHMICNHIEVRKLFDLPHYMHSNRYGSMYTPPQLLKSRTNASPSVESISSNPALLSCEGSFEPPPPPRHASSAPVITLSSPAQITPPITTSNPASETTSTSVRTPSRSDRQTEASETPIVPSTGNADNVSHLSPTVSSLTHGMGFMPMSMQRKISVDSSDGRGSTAAGDVVSPISSEGVTRCPSPPTSSPDATPAAPMAPAAHLTPRVEPSIRYPIRGSNWLDVEFTDQTDAEKFMYRDLQHTHNFPVRGKTYMIDNKKLHTGPALCRLVIMELYEVESGVRHDHVASMGLAKERIDALNSIAEPPELFVMNFQIPGDPPVSIMSIFAAPPDIRTESPHDSDDYKVIKRMWRRYMDMPKSNEERLKQLGLFNTDGPSVSSESSMGGSGGYYRWKLPSDITWADSRDEGVYPSMDFKNTRFKLIPTVTEGNWMVRSAVPSAKPALLGQKLQQRYFSGLNYVETDVDVGSSVIASQIVGVLRGYAKNFACDVGVVLQGESEDELPERMLCCIVINKVDMELRRKLSSTSILPPLSIATKGAASATDSCLHE